MTQIGKQLCDVWSPLAIYYVWKAMVGSVISPVQRGEKCWLQLGHDRHFILSLT